MLELVVGTVVPLVAYLVKRWMAQDARVKHELTRAGEIIDEAFLAAEAMGLEHKLTGKDKYTQAARLVTDAISEEFGRPAKATELGRLRTRAERASWIKKLPPRVPAPVPR